MSKKSKMTYVDMAKNNALMYEISVEVNKIPSKHELNLGSSIDINWLREESVHLVLTSPPYWNLKEYNNVCGQLGHIDDYNQFLASLKKVFKHCYRVLVPGGRICCVVGDVCLSRRNNNGRHCVYPLHSSIVEMCRDIGFDNLTPIIWHKISNIITESSKGGAILGRPYQPNAIIKNDIEYILMFRKFGSYRSVSEKTRQLSLISEDNFKLWFRSIWSDIPGVSILDHPAPFPEKLAGRLIRMFSFVGDIVLDPFMGTGTTNFMAEKYGRNSIGIEIDPFYFESAYRRLDLERLLDTIIKKNIR